MLNWFKGSLPDWYDKWERDNPINAQPTAVKIGVAGGIVFITAMAVTWGNPLANVSMQTGPRGTGMSIPEFKADLAQPDPTIEAFYSTDPIVPQEGDPLAVDTYDNVEEPLAQVTVANYDRLVEAMRLWTGIPDLMEDPEHYQTQVAWNMIRMTQNINETWAGHVYANGEVGVTCYTCHRGQPVPSDIWFRIAPVNESAQGWSAVQNRVTMQSQYTSLPSDALEQYLLNGERIVVHNLESRVSENPSDPGVATWQDTERTYSLMNYFSNALGKNCLLCHNSRAFYAASGQVTPQWATASLGITMVLELNNDYLVPLRDVYPPERLGPVHADAPKAACRTCHKGYQQPLQGLNVIGDWPELATTGAPSY